MRRLYSLIALMVVFGVLAFSLPSISEGALVLADTGASQVLKKYFNGTTPAGGNNLTLKLFCTNVTPADTNTASSYTECTGGGYAAITLTAGSWTESNVGGIEQVAYAAQTFTFTGALTTNGTIYGYYVVDADNTLIWAEALGSTFTPANNGDTVQITGKFQMSKGTPN